MAKRLLQEHLDDWAARRFLKRFLVHLNKVDPLTARRLRFAIENNFTMEEVLALEEQGLHDLASLIIDRAKDHDVHPATDE